ncbi:type II and III secretion system protein family protein [Mariprofundus ferrinatatus]|uniref:type II and III secretion system protein family protein n=1 Tax=Mariprofundus ferrinatatus TaxID=1921087 RepID=UPI0018E1E79C|nr:type II and III secretion system protein family protein [Mariprofundus ferrinatatus]
MLLIIALIAMPAYATDSFTLDLGDAAKSGELNLAVGKSKIINSPVHIKEIVIGKPEVVDVKLLNSRKLLVLGKAAGYTNVAFRDSNKNLIALLDVSVGYDVEAIKFKLHQMMPGEKDLQVRSSNEMVILSGNVSSALAMDTALVVARSFAPNGVTNLMRVDGNGQQVMLEVRIAEIERTSLKQLGVNGTLAGNIGRTNLSSALNGAVANAFGTLGVVYRGLNLTLSALETQGLAKVLAEPNLVALSGQEGSFLVGGEFPIDVAQSGAVAGAITVEYKEFGVGLKFTPTVLDSTKINLQLQAEVSSIAAAATLSNAPTLRTRRASTTVEVADGQSFAIAGLIQNDVNNNIDKVPGLGDVPVLGALFRSTDFQRNETELVIMITPRLVKPMAAGPVALPTDNFVPPSDVDQYLMGRLQGSPKDAPATTAPSGPATGTDPGGVDGAFGHQL